MMTASPEALSSPAVMRYLPRVHLDHRAAAVDIRHDDTLYTNLHAAPVLPAFDDGF